MENASKALIIAGSVLMAVLVIGALMIMYNQIADIEQTKTDNDELSKMEDYSKKFEEYNTTIYGSELFSLANLQDDYTKRYKQEDGYTKITINVKINKSISGTNYFQAGNNDINKIFTDKNKIEKDITEFENKNKFKGKTVKYYSQLTIREIADIYRVGFNSDDLESDVEEKIRQSGGEAKKVLEAIDEYKNIKSVYTEFKNKRFKCTNISYNQYNGRIESMNFEEK